MSEKSSAEHGIGLDEKKWKLLLHRIKSKKCTPFIGAGACHGTLPSSHELAAELAKKYDYPLPDNKDLLRVSEYIAMELDSIFPKTEIQEYIVAKGFPDFNSPNEPHMLLAELGLPLYITTNYDNFMEKALEKNNKKVEVDYTRWNNYSDNIKEKSIFETKYIPASDHPMVFHLHGHCEKPQSMVLTESDYLDFLIKLSRDEDFLPPAILEALTGTSLLFVGYSLNDWNIRILFRSLMESIGTSLGCRSIAIQLTPEKGMSADSQVRARAYLDDYFDKHFKLEIDVYWGEATQFMTELRERSGLNIGNH